MPDLRPVRGGDAPDRRGQRGGLGAPLRLGQGLVPGHHRTERFGGAVVGQELLRGADDLQRILFRLLRRIAPGGDAVPAEDAADGLRIGGLDRRDVESELEAGASPRHPRHPVTERLAGQLLPVDRGRQGDPGIRVQMVDMRGVDQAVHGGVDRWCGAALSVQAVVERRDHLVLPLHPGVDVHQGTEPVQPEHGEVRRLEGAEVAAGALDPQQLHFGVGHWIDTHALGGGVAAGVVGVPRVGAQPVGPVDQILRGGVGLAHRKVISRMSNRGR